MIIQLTNSTFDRTGKTALPNINPYPLQLLSTVLWLSAETGVTSSSGVVAAWKDRITGALVSNNGSPNAIDLIADDQNGLPGIATSQTVSGSVAYLRSASNIAALDAIDYDTPFSLTFTLRVSSFASGSSDKYLFAYSGLGGPSGFFFNTDYQGAGSICQIGLIEVSPNTVFSATFPRALFNGATTLNLTLTYDGVKTFKVYVNGLAAGTAVFSAGTPSSTIKSASPVLSLLGLTTNTYSPDHLMEIVVNNAALTATQVTAMDAYLNKKWAVHP